MLLDSKEPTAQLFTSVVDPHLTKLYLSWAEAVAATGCPWQQATAMAAGHGHGILCFGPCPFDCCLKSFAMPGLFIF